MEPHLVPFGPRSQSLVDILELPLALADIVAWVVARLLARADPRKLRQRPLRRCVVESFVGRELFAVAPYLREEERGTQEKREKEMNRRRGTEGE